jgi:pantoate--beta-alanine ligase
VLAAARAVLDDASIDLDYLELTSPELAEPPKRGEGRLLVAGRVGTTRLIDNVAVQLGGTGSSSS